MAPITLSVLSAISNYSATLSSLTLSFARSINGVSDPKQDIKKKTLTSLGDGDSYNDKLNRNKQPHQ